MKSRLNSSSRFFLIVAFACAIFASGTEMQAQERAYGARLIVKRVANFGTYFILRVEIDGRTLANVPRGQRYDGFVPAGNHVLTISSYPNASDRRATSMRLKLRPGATYVFTAAWVADQIVLHW
jgi:hypothetical protein